MWKQNFNAKTTLLLLKAQNLEEGLSGENINSLVWGVWDFEIYVESGNLSKILIFWNEEQ